MKTRIILSAFAALALLSGCNNDDKQQMSSQNDDGRIPIMLSATSTREVSRASQDIQNTSFEKGKKIDVQITSVDNKTGYDMLTYFVSDNSGNLQPSSGIFPFYPTNGANVNIRAIYPTGYMNKNSFTVSNPNQVSADAYRASDLMFAKVEDVAKPDNPNTSVQLNFHHLMSKIQVNLTGEGGVVLSGAVVRLLGVKTQTTFNNLTGEVLVANAAGEPTNIKMTTDGSEGCAAIIVPQEKASGYLLEIVLQNNDVLHYKTVQSFTFESGKVYTFNITVIESNINVNTTVDSWDDTTTDVQEDLKL